MDEKDETGRPRRYTWPWFVLGFVVLGIVLAIIWMSVLVRRTRDQRDNTAWPAAPTPSAPQTNSTAPHAGDLPHESPAHCGAS